MERAIRETGVDDTFLRVNLFMQGLLEGRFYAAAGDAKVSLVDVRDIAAAAAAVLTGEGHAGKTYTLLGPEALSHAVLAAKLSDALGRTITFVDMSPEAMREALSHTPMPAWQADGLIEDYVHYHRGEASAVTSGVQDAAGTVPRSFETFAQDFAAAFS